MSGDRFKGALEAFVRNLLAKVDYLALYPAKVIAQSSDGSVDVRPDSGRLPGMTGVPLRLGVPGVKIKVKPGARVLIGFEGGDPQKPIAACWETSGLQELAFGGGTQSVARVGDTLSLSIPPGTPILGQLSGQPFTGAFTTPVTVTGTILTGSNSIKA